MEGGGLQAPTGSGKITLRDMADDLLEHRRVEFIHEDALTIVAPRGHAHASIVADLTEAFSDAWHAKQTRYRWRLRAGDFQFEWNDPLLRFSVPDLAIGYPGTASNTEFRDALMMVVEVTSPKSKETVENDFVIKRKQYAKGGVPLYLLVDQLDSSWHLHALVGDWPGYQVYSDGRYGEAIALPEPFGFALPTDTWPAYDEKGD